MEKRPALLSNEPSPVPSAGVAMASPSSLTKLFGPVRRIDLVVFIFLLVVWAMQIGLYQRVESYQEDSSCYVGLAHSLITTGRYEFNFKLHTEHPPGLPIILGATSLLFGGTYDADVRVVATLGVFGLFLAYLLLRKREPPGSPVPAAACLLLGTSPYFFEIATKGVLSELPYFALSMATLLVATKVEEAPSTKSRISWSAVLAICTLGAVMVRTAGIALPLGMMLWLGWAQLGKKPQASRRFLAFAPALVLALGAQLAWMQWTKKVEVYHLPGKYNDYVSQFKMKDPRQPELGQASASDLAIRGANNVVIQSADFTALSLHTSWIEPMWYSPAVFLPLLLVLLGWWASVRGGNGDFVEGYFACYAGLYFLWPWDSGPRFVLPVFPLVFLYFSRGARSLMKIARERWQPSMIVAFASSAILSVVSAWLTFAHHRPSSLQEKSSVAFFVIVAAISGFMAFADARNAPLTWTRGLVGSSGLRWIRLGAGTCVFILVIVGITLQLRIGIRNLSPDPSTYLHYPSVSAAKWVEEHTPVSEVLMAGQDVIVYRVSGRRVIPFPVTTDARLIVGTMRLYGVKDLIVLTRTGADSLYLPRESDRLAILMRSYSKFFRLVNSGPGYQIFNFTDH